MGIPAFFTTPEHDLLRQSTRRFVERELLPNADAWEEEGIPLEAFSRVAEAGLVGARYAESLGGGGGDLLTAVPVIEELSRCHSGGFVTSYLVQSHLSLSSIAQLGTLDQQKEFLRPALHGTRLGCLAITEPDAGSDVANMATKARRDGSDWLISGSKMFITNGGIADFAVVAARSNDSPNHQALSLFIVDTNQRGYQASPPLRKVGCKSSNTVALALDDVRVPERNLLGSEGLGFRYIMESFREERLVSSIYAYSSAREILELTLQYLRSRTAYGRTLADLQAVRHAVAQLAAELEAIRQLCYATAWKLNSGVGDASLEASMCKLLSADTANRVAYQAVQFHGGYAYMEESRIARYSRDIRMYSIGGGASEVQRDIIAKRTFSAD